MVWLLNFFSFIYLHRIDNYIIAARLYFSTPHTRTSEKIHLKSHAAKGKQGPESRLKPPDHSFSEKCLQAVCDLSRPGARRSWAWPAVKGQREI